MSHSSTEPTPPPVARCVVGVSTGMLIAIVVLRLAVGWHFYREGTKKLAYNPRTGLIALDFSAEPMLRQAVGPAAELIKENLPDVHAWEQLLASPRQARPSTDEERAARVHWEAEYAARRSAAAAKKEPQPVEFPPHAPHGDWAKRIEGGWQDVHDRFVVIGNLSSEQRAAAARALDFRRQQLADYLAAEADAIAEWRHELFRLQNMNEDASAADLPFLKARIKEKRAETKVAGGKWVAQVREFEEAYRQDLREILTAEQAADAALAAEVDEALIDADAQKLHRLNATVTCVIIGVGACLLLGLLTRLASLVGIGFLLSVMATQPPWTPGAQNPVLYYQFVEIAALAVLFAAAAGRYAGLDYFIRRFACRCCGRKESVSS